MSFHPDTTLADVLERVPPLLHSIVTALAVKPQNSQYDHQLAPSSPHEARRSAIATVRLISKQASTAALQAVSGYCLRLMPLALCPTERAPEVPVAVANLLCQCKLQRLRVEVELPPGETSKADVLRGAHACTSVSQLIQPLTVDYLFAEQAASCPPAMEEQARHQPRV